MMNKYHCYCPVCHKTHTVEINGRIIGIREKLIDNKNYHIRNCGRHTFDEFRTAIGLKPLETKHGRRYPDIIGQFD